MVAPGIRIELERSVFYSALNLTGKKRFVLWVTGNVRDYNIIVGHVCFSVL